VYCTSLYCLLPLLAHHTPRTCRISIHRQPSCSWHPFRSLAPTNQPTNHTHSPFSPSSRTRPHWEGTTQPRPSVALGTHLPEPHLPSHYSSSSSSAVIARTTRIFGIFHQQLIFSLRALANLHLANSNRRRSHSSGNQLPPNLQPLYPHLIARRLIRPRPNFSIRAFFRALLSSHDTAQYLHANANRRTTRLPRPPTADQHREGFQ